MAHHENTSQSVVLQVDSSIPAAAATNLGAMSCSSVMQEAAASPSYKNTPSLTHLPNKLPPKFNVLQKGIAEMIGAFFIIFVGCAGSILNAANKEDIGHAKVMISGGISVMIMIFVIGHISAAHMNPAVTLGFAVAGRFPWKHVAPYIIFQIIGSILASLILHILVHDATTFSLTINRPLHHSMESLVMEFVATFILQSVNMKVACNLRKIGELGGILMIGMTVALLGFYAGPFCGGLSMNPARSIGPALITLNVKSVYIYIIGPIAGATLSSLTYSIICPE